MSCLKVTVEYIVFPKVILVSIIDDYTVIEVKQPWEVIGLISLIQTLVVALRMLQSCGSPITFKIDICLIQIRQDRPSISDCR